jgi:hypothetical protein
LYLSITAKLQLWDELKKVGKDNRTYLDIIYELIKADMLMSNYMKVDNSEEKEANV